MKALLKYSLICLLLAGQSCGDAKDKNTGSTPENAEAQAGSQQCRTDEGSDFHGAAPVLFVSLTANAELLIWLTGRRRYPDNQWPMACPVRTACPGDRGSAQAICPGP